MATSTTPLTSGWKFRKAYPAATPHVLDNLHDAKSVPGEIHVDLLEHDLIPDPFKKKNELLVQWVGEEAWHYELTFPSPPSGGKQELVFEGLDTFAIVTLNGKEILETSNMFTPYRVDVTEVLKKDEGENLLEVLFESAYLRGKKEREKYPDFPWGGWNGDSSRFVVRKAQYHYGWDWGPVLMACGIWKPVYIETFESRITDLYFVAEVREHLHSARIDVTVEVEGIATEVEILLQNPDGSKFESAKAKAVDGKATTHFVVKNPELWWPHGYGEQPLYTLTATLGEALDQKKKKLGLRRARLVERPLKDEEGTSFFFEINNTPLWVGGSNWIPADSFLTTVDEARYRKWLELAKEGNQIMIRVWAGGIYESDVFYDIADELGLLVWQDFAFGCGNYPAHIAEFRESVKQEAISNVKRLRHHPSLVIWAGNNEDYSYMWGIEGKLGYDADDKNPENWLRTGFPARYLYEKLLPEVVAEFSPGTTYHRGSPYGNPDRPDGWYQKVGDNHQWNVWHGTQEKYQNFDKLSGRFVSEFGMEAFPSHKTVKSYLPEDDPSEHHSFSSTVEFHNKADGAERRIATYLAENITFRHEPLESYIYSTQLMQSEALSSAYRLWRRNWKGPGREYNAGALVWQINDCWPVTSWAIIDYDFIPKLSYYGIKRALEPITIGSKRTEVRTPRDPYTDAHVEIQHHLSVWVSSFMVSIDKSKSYTLTLKAFDIKTGKLLTERKVAEMLIPVNRTVEFPDFVLPGWKPAPPGTDTHHRIVVGLYLNANEDGRLVARDVSWPEPLKYIDFSKSPGVKVSKGDNGLVVEAEKPVKGVEVVGEDGTAWKDNGIDLLPGDKVLVGGDLKVSEVGLRWLTGEKTVQAKVL